MVEPGRVIASAKAKRVVVITGAQSGKTEMLLDVMGQRLDQKPAPILYVGPNKQFLTEQFEPRVMNLLDESASLASKLARGKRMTKTRKVVAGVPVRLAHAGSSAALKSDPAALALVDEYDEMLANVKGQGDPLGLVERRGDTYADFVCAVTSTPRKGMVQTSLDDRTGLIFWAVADIEDIESPIWRLWQNGTRHHFAWPCPHCTEFFIPRFDLVRYPKEATPTEAERDTHLECPRCGGVIEDRHKEDMNARGVFVAPGQKVTVDGTVIGDPPDAPSISFWTSGLASPFVTFGERVKVLLEAMLEMDDSKIQTAMNAGFAELYTPGGQDIKEWQQVSRRKTMLRFGEIPLEAVKLSCAVDVQKTGLVYSIRGWGARATSWQIESAELAGYTDQPEVWNDLTQVLSDTYDGLHISLALIDSGFRPDKPNAGSDNMVYEFCRRFRRFVRPTKGYATLSAPIVKSNVKATIPGKGVTQEIELVRLDTDFWKQRLHERLSWPEDQPGGFHLSADATDDYCKQLVSEVRKLTPSGKPQWIRISRRNHFFDCEAMNEAAGHMLNAQKLPTNTRRTPVVEGASVAVSDAPSGPMQPIHASDPYL